MNFGRYHNGNEGLYWLDISEDVYPPNCPSAPKLAYLRITNGVWNQITHKEKLSKMVMLDFSPPETMDVNVVLNDMCFFVAQLCSP